MVGWLARLRRYPTVAIALALACMLAWPAGAGAQDLPLRKNIDDLSATELAAYEHAIQILKDRSAADRLDREGYLWQAWIHNCMFIFEPDGTASGAAPRGERCDFGTPPSGYVRSSPGMCEHGKDIFLLWHRAQFYYFEQLLRATDPDGTVTDSRGVTGPSTADLAVPYWNWMRPPSGVRYPKAMEERTSPLYHQRRRHNALTPEERRQLGPATNVNLLAYLVYAGNWPQFGGYPQADPAGGKGVFESAQHDPMHSLYFDGDMSSPVTAALDPGFFNFHSYIDLVLEFWLRNNGTGAMTSLRQYLRATQPASVTPAPDHDNGQGLPSMGRGQIYLDTTTLGYGYQVKPADQLPTRRQVATLLTDATGEALSFGLSERSPQAALAGDGFNRPELGPPTQIAQLPVALVDRNRDAIAQFARPADAPDVSYRIDFYLHPQSIVPDMADEAFRQRYIYAARGYWGAGRPPSEMAMMTVKPAFLRLDQAMASLLGSRFAGDVWTLTAVITGPDPDPAFGTLSLTAAD
mgnify:CR=1 FL=1